MKPHGPWDLLKHLTLRKEGDGIGVYLITGYSEHLITRLPLKPVEKEYVVKPLSAETTLALYGWEPVPIEPLHPLPSPMEKREEEEREERSRAAHEYRWFWQREAAIVRRMQRRSRHVYDGPSGRLPLWVLRYIQDHQI